MNRRFRFKPKAAEDLDRIETYLAQNASLEVAERFIDISDAAFQRLATMPELGAIRKFANRELRGLRMWLLGSGFVDSRPYASPGRGHAARGPRLLSVAR